MKPKGPRDESHVDWLAEQMAPQHGTTKVAVKPKSTITAKPSGSKPASRAAQKPSTSTSVPVEELAVYSYKDYTKPKPVLVFTKHEEEANDLVDGLKPG